MTRLNVGNIRHPDGTNDNINLTSTGRVGIGTSTPNSLLHIAGSSPALSLIPSDATNAKFIFDNSLTFSGSGGSNDRFHINFDGKVGIGTTSPGTILHVASTAPYIRIQDTDSNTGVTAQGGFEMYDSDGDRLFYLANESSSSADVGLFNMAGGALKFGTSGSERGQFDSSGRLLVGTSTARGDNRLQVEGNADGAGIFLRRDVSAGALTTPGTYLGTINFGNTEGGIGAFIRGEADAAWSGSGSTDNPGRLVFSTTEDGASSPTERMRIQNNGNVLINTTTLGAGIGFPTKLAIDGGALGDTAVFKNAAGSSANLLYCWNAGTSGNNGFIAFGTEGTYTQRGLINYNRGSGVVAYNTTSDYRAKTLVGQVENPGATIDALKVYRGVMNGATVERPMLVAHEAQEVAPYCVTGEKDAVDDKGNPIYQQMDHQVLVPLLIAEIQQLRARVAALESA